MNALYGLDISQIKCYKNRKKYFSASSLGVIGKLLKIYVCACVRLQQVQIGKLKHICRHFELERNHTIAKFDRHLNPSKPQAHLIYFHL